MTLYVQSCISCYPFPKSPFHKVIVSTEQLIMYDIVGARYDLLNPC